MVKKIIISVISVLVLTVVGCFIGINWKSIKTLMSGAQIYTKEQMEESYNQGYKDANTNEDTYITQIDYYKNLVEDNELELTNYKNQVANLTNSNNNYANQVNSLNQTIQTNEETISNLQSLIDTNDITIDGLNNEIANYKSQINVLEKEIITLQSSNDDKTLDIQNKQNQIASLNNQVNNLQHLVNQLNTTNETNLETINTLNNQIQSLNSQISDLKLQINNNNTNVDDLNNRIADLENSIAYYEQYISNLETETQVVATFEFDGTVYNVQILNKGAYASVVAPTSTDYIVFNGWTVNNEIVDLSTYALNENTKFVADVTYKYDVKFSVDNVITESQIVVKNTCATLPTSPIKDGYTFDGWTVDGVNLVDISSYTITTNTTFTAVFTKMYTVTFVYEDETISTQSIKNGDYAENVTVEDTVDKIFNGWLSNGTTVDINTYKISADTVFVADIIYKKLVTFMVDNETFASEYVVVNNYVINPSIPSKNGYSFMGWSIDGENVIDLSSVLITDSTTFVAIFESNVVTYVGSDFDTRLGYNYNFSGYNVRVEDQYTSNKAMRDLSSILYGELECFDVKLVLNIAIDDETTTSPAVVIDETNTNFIQITLDKSLLFDFMSNRGETRYVQLDNPYTLSNGTVITELAFYYNFYSYGYFTFPNIKIENGVYYSINNMEIVEFTYIKQSNELPLSLITGFWTCAVNYDGGQGFMIFEFSDDYTYTYYGAFEDGSQGGDTGTFTIDGFTIVTDDQGSYIYDVDTGLLKHTLFTYNKVTSMNSSVVGYYGMDEESLVYFADDGNVYGCDSDGNLIEIIGTYTWENDIYVANVMDETLNCVYLSDLNLLVLFVEGSIGYVPRVEL